MLWKTENFVNMYKRTDMLYPVFHIEERGSMVLRNFDNYQTTQCHKREEHNPESERKLQTPRISCTWTFSWEKPSPCRTADVEGKLCRLVWCQVLQVAPKHFVRFSASYGFECRISKGLTDAQNAFVFENHRSFGKCPPWLKGYETMKIISFYCQIQLR
jgi:hypothetical protein